MNDFLIKFVYPGRVIKQKFFAIKNFPLVALLVSLALFALLSACSKKKENPPPPPPLSCGTRNFAYDVNDGFWYDQGNRRVNCVVDVEAVKHKPLIRHQCDGPDAHNGYSTTSQGEILYCSNGPCSPESRDKGVQYYSNGDEILCGWETTEQAWTYGNFEFRDLNIR